MSSPITPTSSSSGTASGISDGVSGIDGGQQPGTEPDGGQLATVEIDRLAAEAVDLARAAAEDVAEPGTVGDHLGARSEGPGLVLHTFACTSRGYRGWQWAVSLARVPDSDVVTVCDTVLLPGDAAVLAPQWLPWSDRLAPGDLGAGDELPYRDDDPLLVPGYMATDQDDADQVEFWELGLGRVRVLGLEGRQDAATRWYRGNSGPTSEIAIQAPASCSTCGYFVPLSGALRRAFGVCANEWSPSDASVVSTDHGCGAHSETDVAPPEPEPIPDMIVDDSVLDVVALEPDPEPVPEPEPDPEPVPEPELVLDPEPVPEVEPVVEVAEAPVTDPDQFALPGAADPVSDAPPQPEDHPVPVEPLEPLADVNDVAGLSAGSVVVEPGEFSPDESPLLHDPRPELSSPTRDDAQDALQAEIQAAARPSDAWSSDAQPDAQPDAPPTETEDGDRPAGAEPPAS